MMIARHCGYEAGVFTHFVANEQIYDRHISQADEMMYRYNLLCNRYMGMTREEIENDIKNNSPKLILNPAKTNFYNFNIDDFTMINYDPIKPNIKLELGI
jgi:thymidylate synthase